MCKVSDYFDCFNVEPGSYLSLELNQVSPKIVRGKPGLSETRGRKKKFSVRIIYEEYGFFSNAHAPHFRSNVCSQRKLMMSHSTLESERNKKIL